MSEERHMTVGDWILTFIILAIPLVNLIMLLVWALGGTANPSKKTYAQATILLFVLGVALFVIFVTVMGVRIPHSPTGLTR